MSLSDYLINEAGTIAQALQQLDMTGRHCVFVVDAESRLVGSLTDGDIRRFLLGGGGLEDSVKEAAVLSPRSMSLEDRKNYRAPYFDSRVFALPIIDDDGVVVDIVFSDNSTVAPKRKECSGVPVVVMAGGMGTRLLPYTAVIPKLLIPVNGKTIIERIIDRFREYGCDDYRLILNYKRRMVHAYFEELNPDYDITFVDEEKFLGTGGGLRLLQGDIDSTFFLTNCDILIDADFNDLYAVHKNHGNAVTIVCSLRNYVIPYGTVEIGEGGNVLKMSEKPSISALVNTGCYVVEPSVLGLIEPGESIGFPDVVERCREKGLKVGAYPISEGSWLDMGQIEEFEHMSEVLESSNDE